jgi:hypothetical protein
MKRVKFSDYPRRWDQFSEFHVHTTDGFVQFESGVIINNGYRFDPDQRNRKTSHDTYITMTSDRKFDFYINDEKIPTAWLTQNGNPYLHVDLEFETDNVARLAVWNEVVCPSNMNGAKAISINDKTRMVGSMIEVSKPYKASKEELDWMAEVREQCRILNELDPYEISRWQRFAPLIFIPEVSRTFTPTDWVNHQADATGTNVDAKANLAMIAKCGFTYNRIVEKVNHLTTKPRSWI